jgi:GrpB-like predicted nucleotidyltransferase (UPF0157 family)
MSDTPSSGPIVEYTYRDYANAADVFRPYDPSYPEVARRVIDMIAARMPDARLEHIGSTAVPGCAGKGTLDLLLAHPPGRLAAARDTLDELGFQRQAGVDPFPEERPMRVGAIEHGGTTHRIHVHVICADDPEADELLRLRDQLRADPALMADYVASKLAALAGGTINNITYNVAKQPVISRILAGAPQNDGQAHG